MKKFKGKIVDPHKRKIITGEVHVDHGYIKDIVECEVSDENYILPGLIDAHIHIESSMLTPQNFARIAVRHGTVAVVSDPHEIANVMGVQGIEYMLKNAREAIIRFYFGVPSCVPATDFETSGAKIDAKTVENLLTRNDLYFLSEMMNFPGVINEDEEVLDKIESARRLGKKIDGHAPGLTGNSLKKYAMAGISTDHECSGIEEAIEKIKNGMTIQIRQGSAAKNFEALHPLLATFPDHVMLCSDDLHPDDLLVGHINLIVKRALQQGYDLFDVIRSVSVNPVMHYNLETGTLQVGDRADFILVNNLDDFQVQKTICKGEVVFEINKDSIEAGEQEEMNNFYLNAVRKEDLSVIASGSKMKVIGAMDGELLTQRMLVEPKLRNGVVVSDTNRDILKIVVVNRYKKEKPAVGYIHGFGIKNGGLATSIAHDSHNILVLGTNDDYIFDLIEWVQKCKGGIALHDGKEIFGIELEVAGIISRENGESVAKKYSQLSRKAKDMGCSLQAPFMTLSFMALLVIPEIKIGNQGLFDVSSFKHTGLFDGK